jgi:hypothetical protein
VSNNGGNNFSGKGNGVYFVNFSLFWGGEVKSTWYAGHKFLLF